MKRQLQQKKHRQYRHGHVVVPTTPPSNLILVKSCFPFGILYCSFDSISATLHLRQLLQRGILRGITKSETESPIFSDRASNDEPNFLKGKILNRMPDAKGSERSHKPAALGASNRESTPVRLRKTLHECPHFNRGLFLSDKPGAGRWASTGAFPLRNGGFGKSGENPSVRGNVSHINDFFFVKGLQKPRLSTVMKCCIAEYSLSGTSRQY
jgi:hypothetical protein